MSSHSSIDSGTNDVIHDTFLANEKNNRLQSIVFNHLYSNAGVFSVVSMCGVVMLLPVTLAQFACYIKP